MIDLKFNKNDINNNSLLPYEKINFDDKTYNKNNNYDELCETENINTNNDVPEIIMKDSKYFKNKIMDILKKLSIVFLFYAMFYILCLVKNVMMVKMYALLKYLGYSLK